MKIIGITGGVGAGKSQILEYLNNKYGATTCEADEVARRLQKKGHPCYDEIVEHFGESILDDRGELERETLAKIVFNDPDELAVLNGIVHPAVKEEVKLKIQHEERKNTNLFILEAALLIEDGYEEICDELWYIYVDASTRKNRLVYARGYSSKKVDEIIAAQPPKSMYMEHCDRVIDNSSIFEETKMQLDAIMREL